MLRKNDPLNPHVFAFIWEPTQKLARASSVQAFILFIQCLQYYCSHPRGCTPHCSNGCHLLPKFLSPSCCDAVSYNLRSGIYSGFILQDKRVLVVEEQAHLKALKKDKSLKIWQFSKSKILYLLKKTFEAILLSNCQHKFNCIFPFSPLLCCWIK